MENFPEDIKSFVLKQSADYNGRDHATFFFDFPYPIVKNDQLSLLEREVELPAPLKNKLAKLCLAPEEREVFNALIALSYGAGAPHGQSTCAEISKISKVGVERVAETLAKFHRHDLMTLW